MICFVLLYHPELKEPNNVKILSFSLATKKPLQVSSGTPMNKDEIPVMPKQNNSQNLAWVLRLTDNFSKTKAFFF